MSARDDYPLVRALDALNGGPSALDEIDRLRAEVERLRKLHDYVNACRVEAPDVLHYVSDTHYDHRTDRATNLIAVFKSMVSQ